MLKIINIAIENKTKTGSIYSIKSFCYFILNAMLYMAYIYLYIYIWFLMILHSFHWNTLAHSQRPFHQDMTNKIMYAYIHYMYLYIYICVCVCIILRNVNWIACINCLCLISKYLQPKKIWNPNLQGWCRD